MKKTADTTTDTNKEQALVDFVVTPNAGDDEAPGDPTSQPTPQSRPSNEPWMTLPGTPSTVGRGSAPVPRNVPSDEATPPSQPGFSEAYPSAKKEIDMNNIKGFQQLFASMGMWDSNKLDGKMDPRLADLGREIERNIANKIGNQSIIGMIVSMDGNSFNTTPEDVSDALRMIERYQKSQKGSKYSMDDRLVSFARLIQSKS